jgi:cytochrome oxidase Cu insertion factor (SCO1/SenC/PrrC family)
VCTRTASFLAISVAFIFAYCPPATAQAQNAADDAKGEALAKRYAELGEEADKIGHILTDERLFTDPAFRKKVAPEAVPVLRKVFEFTAELLDAGGETAAMGSEMRFGIGCRLVMFDDAATIKLLEDQARGKDETARIAKAMLLGGGFFRVQDDRVAQLKLLDEFAKAIEADADTGPLQDAMGFILEKELDGVSPDVEERLNEVSNMLDKARNGAEEKQFNERLQSFVGKPFEISGVTHEGKELSTAELKGSVVAVVFWNIMQFEDHPFMGSVIEASANLKPEGLRVVHVMIEFDEESLKSFREKHAAAEWIHLVDKNQRRHPLMLAYAIDHEPTVLLIDKKGVLRTVEGENKFDKWVKLLAAE